MIKTIPVDDLKPGVYVHDLRCGWFDHPFARGRFLITDAKTLAQIRGLGVRQVEVDTTRGLDPSPEPLAEAPPAEPVAPVENPPPQRCSLDFQPVSVREERGIAMAVRHEAVGTIVQIMNQVRFGRPVEPDQAEAVVEKMLASVFRNQDALLSLCLIRDKDYYTFEHSVSVAVLAMAMGRALEFDPKTLKGLGMGALLHDIGKARVPSEILNKPGKLSDQEFRIIKQHVVHSRGILEQMPGVSEVALQAAAEHHERYDGSGYPNGLVGEQISIYGRVMALCDVYDAFTADRCYRGAEEPGGVMKRMLEWGGSHFEASLVHQFIRCVGIYPVGTLVRMQSGRLAVVVEAGSRGLLHPVVRVFFDGTRGRFIAPKDLDLSGEPLDYEDDRIVSYESPADWDVQPQDFMD